MQMFNRAAALLCAAALCCGLLSGCDKGGKALSLDVSVGSGLESLDPIYATEVGDQTLINHLYENLMRLNVDANGGYSAVPAMAKNVDVEENTDGTMTYTFRLRSAEWSDGRAVKADDFVYAWQRLIDPANASPFAHMLQTVCGYEEARESGDLNLLQVTAKNDTTLVVNLTGDYEWFLTQVCTAPATVPVRREQATTAAPQSEEAVEVAVEEEPWWADPTELLVNGPYQVAGYVEGQGILLGTSETYYNAAKYTGPESIQFSFAKTAAEARAMYDQGSVDAIWPLEGEALARQIEEESAAYTLDTYTLLFNGAAAPFQDRAIRQAVVKVIDRNAIAAAAGEGAEAAAGFVPYGVPDSVEKDFRTCAGETIGNDPALYAQYCMEAQEIIIAAGYDSGASFGELEYLYISGGSNDAVAQELCRQLHAVLQMNVTPRGVTAEEMEEILAGGEYTMAGLELTSFGNDAECFLLDWASESKKNVVYYENTAYDTLMAIIATAPDGVARMGCLHDAEDLLLDDAPLTPLYHSLTGWELREELTGALRDPRGFFSFIGTSRKTA